MSSHDEWYGIWKFSKAATACVIRVTNKCDQKCRHCAFRSGPSNKERMSVEMCEKINRWVPRNILLNIMGGEVTVLPNYREILVTLAKGRGHIRLVTNGYWEKSPNRFFDTIKQIRNMACLKVDVAVSQDHWHEKQSHLAISLLRDGDNGINLVEPGDIDVGDIAPVGRAWDNMIRPDTVDVHQCEEMSNMIITEDGMISRCPFGYFPWKHFSETTWHDTQEYVWGWRSERLSEGMNCHLCMECDATGRLR